jgi:hypothetical protein
LFYRFVWPFMVGRLSFFSFALATLGQVQL